MNIPDFKKWKSIAVESIFLDITRLRIYYQEAELEDEGEIYWVGYRIRYFDPDTLGRGTAFNFFGKGEVLRIWRSGSKMRRITIFTPSGWKEFDAEEYSLRLICLLKALKFSVIHITLQGKEAWRGQEVFRVVK
ncbi:MAG: hypothetical protein A3I24_00140 [Candidatus Harrisonbacteria bacterium RIFCSPLOWO2_02_FULL_41_13b]|uniref:Uncharacterized protein n=1 Tax=Candidatus Harrisonbacteria bacterium RIFCSPLOWO2_02_FULL_41_13b TaxID=1798409 RepID=A0A1G1ZSP1_9BACT|nr:MAG: hypothetical protein A3J53_00845 [Candidatus Harrisonbacteria bacterium RIFCSPHIGHO2_02_FULL_40_20]OGY67495.1 MAG: hypothetical protein A3I24_00140 [Candidatus Harrisonbacteria bacterium RIFCSPLOWO2_02_FULL_41_13b]